MNSGEVLPESPSTDDNDFCQVQESADPRTRHTNYDVIVASGNIGNGDVCLAVAQLETIGERVLYE